MRIQINETVCAISSAPGMGAIGIIRISGSRAHQFLKSIFFSNQNHDFQHGKMVYGKILDQGKEIDRAMAVVFMAPNSYTGEDMAEIYCHGSPFILQRVVRMLIDIGCSFAEPGAFTMKAFMNGKMDLMQAEGVNDLIHAHSEASSDMALRQMRGDYSKTLIDIRNDLIRLTALFELEIDFAEEDVEFAPRNELLQSCQNILAQSERIAKSFSAGNVIKHGIPIIIAGRPNVGKSTLLNLLIKDDRAIVSEIPGTTRDVLEDVVSIGRHTFRFVDTAGLRITNDQIESIGIAKAKQKIEEANIILFIVDASNFTMEELLNDIKDLKNDVLGFDEKHIVLVFNKMDLIAGIPNGVKEIFNYDVLFISAKKKENIEMITTHLLELVETNQINDGVVLNNIRHYEAFQQIQWAMQNAVKGIKDGMPNDIVSVELRTAIDYLGRVTGQVGVEDILGYVFSNFCIGK